MKIIRLKSQLSADEMKDIKGRFLIESSYDHLIEDDTTVYKPNGDLLLIFRKGIIPNNLCKEAYSVLWKPRVYPSNRGIAALGQTIPSCVMRDGKQRSKTKHISWALMKMYGIANTNIPWRFRSSSAVIGYMDRYTRFPYCRKCAFNLNSPTDFAKALPFIQAVSRAFKDNVPERYAAQAAMVEKTSKDFVIPGTVFTTVTVNKNWRTSVHKDAGDLAAGFGIISILTAGNFTGGELVLPEFRVAFKMKSTDVCFYDVHEWHGNTPIHGIEGQYERVSCVFYYRRDMIMCGSAATELARVKAKKTGDALYTEAERAKRDKALEAIQTVKVVK